jgi:hypothetical protein
MSHRKRFDIAVGPIDRQIGGLPDLRVRIV